MNGFFSRLLHWNIDAGDVIPAQQIQKERNKNSRLSADYLFRCIASALVDTLGLIGNSKGSISHGKAATAQGFALCTVLQRRG